MGLVGILSGGNNGLTKIKDNVVHIVSSDPEISPFIEGITGWGGYFLNAYKTARYEIEHNDVTVGGVLEGVGITVDWTKNSPVVNDNRVNLISPVDVGILLWDVSNANLVDNEIAGEGQYGLVLGHWLYPTFKNSGNTLRGNELGDFTAATADYYLGKGVKHNIIYLEEGDTLLDESKIKTNMVILED